MIQMRPTLETICPHLTSAELQKWLRVTVYMAYHDLAIQDVPKCTAMPVKLMPPFSMLMESGKVRAPGSLSSASWSLTYTPVASTFSAQLEPGSVWIRTNDCERLFTHDIRRYSSRYPNIPSATNSILIPAIHNYAVSIRSNRFFEVRFSYADRADGTGWELRTLPPPVLSPTPFAKRIRTKAFHLAPYGLEQGHLDASLATSRGNLSWRAWVGHGCNPGRWCNKHQLDLTANDTVLTHVKETVKNLDKLVLHYEEFKTSPDAWAQLVKQLAFYNVNGRPAFTRPGRRPAFVWARGVQARPEIYKTPAFSFSSHWELSVSQLSSKYPNRWICGKAVLYGYGLSYSIGDDYIWWKNTNPQACMSRKRCGGPGNMGNAPNSTNTLEPIGLHGIDGSKLPATETTRNGRLGGRSRHQKQATHLQTWILLYQITRQSEKGSKEARKQGREEGKGRERETSERLSIQRILHFGKVMVAKRTVLELLFFDVLCNRGRQFGTPTRTEVHAYVLLDACPQPCAYCVQSSFDGQQVVRHEAAANRKESPPAGWNDMPWEGATASHPDSLFALRDRAPVPSSSPEDKSGRLHRNDRWWRPLAMTPMTPPAILSRLGVAFHKWHDRRGKRRRKKQMGGLLPVDSTEGAAGWKAEAKVEQAHGPLPNERRRYPDRDFVINNTRRPGIRKAIGAWTVLGFEFMIRQKGSN
ncbi:hypothetical protein EDB86DRAFT_2826693 [Lactarius hatsudake]|nr:hypothetical protein EDB86DRAFT_2826693 [Lactarius hatsudake]